MNTKTYIGSQGHFAKNGLLFALCFLFVALYALLFSPYIHDAYAADKLVIKNAAGSSDVFKVGDNGVLNISGTDSYNNFTLNLAGHVGGDRHVQISTAQSNSRLTLLAGDNNDMAPRYVAVGAQDGSLPNRGAAFFDYGSYLYNLPDAKFIVRHFNTTGNQIMVQFYGRDKVVFPIAKVGIGTEDPQGALDVNGAIYQRGGVLHADYVFEPTYKIESIEDHAKYMWENKHLKAISGARTDENGQQIVEVGAHQRGILEELEKAHIYIEQLNSKIRELETKISNLEKSRQ